MVVGPAVADGETGDLESAWQDLCLFQLNDAPQVVDQVLEQLFLLAALFTGHKRGSKLQSKDVQARLDAISTAIEELWSTFQKEMGGSGPAHRSSTCGVKGILNGKDAMTVLTLAYLETARFMLAFLTPSNKHAKVRLQEHSSTILQCTAALSTHSIGCASLRMIFPLTLVATYGPSLELRSAAENTLENWLQIRAFTGLYSMMKYEGGRLAITTTTT